MTRVSFNDGWTVRPRVNLFVGANIGDELQGLNTGPRAVRLPHDAQIESDRIPGGGQGSQGAFFPKMMLEYSKSFEVPEDYRGKRVSVVFEGAYRDAVVIVNGDFAAQRPSGYATFAVSLDAFLLYGQTNTVKVELRANDDSRWYTGAGLYRDTWLHVTDPIHIGVDGARVSTPDIDDRRAVVETATPVQNDSTETRTVTITTTLSDAEGSGVAEESAPVTLRPGACEIIRQRLYVTEPLLWSVEEANLYTASIVLTDAEVEIDSRTTSFGIRTVQVDPELGLRINGVPVKLRGAGIHHDNGLLGSAAIARAEERRVQVLKAAGFNAIRSAHNPISQAMLDACDRHGVLVMDEFSDVWTLGNSDNDYSLAFPEWWERDVESMVAKDFNHPSVILYSIGNEIPETGRRLGRGWGRALAEKFRSLDSTRLITNAINGLVASIDEVLAESGAMSEGAGVNDVMGSAAEFMNKIAASPLATRKTAESYSFLDVAGVNYGDSRYVLDRELFPNRVIIGTETFATRIAANWRLIEENSHVIGEFTWTGWDYLGEVGVGRTQYLAEGEKYRFEADYPWIAAWTGDIDITGVRRPASYYREIVFGLRSTPYIAVQRPEHYGDNAVAGQWSWTDSLGSWSWNVPAGSPIKVEVYSSADEVELELNGRKIGRLPAGPKNEFRAIFDLTYEPGTLTAVAYIDGEQSGRFELASATGPLHLAVEPDRSVICANSSDLSYVSIEIKDAAGNLATNAEHAVSVQVEGAGVLRALGSARPDTVERYDQPEHTSFDGRLLAIVRPTEPGTITLTATARGFEPVTVVLEAAPDELAHARPRACGRDPMNVPW